MKSHHTPLRAIRSIFATITLLVISSTKLGFAAETISTTPSYFRLSYENLTLPQQENMGLAGGTFLYDLNQWIAIGPAAYGAITGHRGGFITLGATTSIHPQLTDHVHADGGVFVGGGGGDGGYTLVGGGLMLRTHLGLFFDTKTIGSFGVGASYIDFPNGGIHSVQPYFSYQYPFDTLVGSGWLSNALASDRTQTLSPTHREFAILYKTYFPTSQQPSLDLMGAEWSRYLHEKWFVNVESEGAMRGENNGYMQILLGGGYRQPLTNSTFIKLLGRLGVAGGGGVPTGGGLLLDASLGLQQYLTHSLYLALHGGYTDAPTGHFKATNVSLQLGYGYDAPMLNKKSFSLSPQGDYSPKHLRARLTNQTYYQADSAWRNHHADEQVNLLGLQLDYFVTHFLYLTGQGLGAYQGNAGAYMTGLIGPGLFIPLGPMPLFLNAEGLVGAAGGGGLDVGGGLVWQTNAGLGYQFNKALSLQGYYGYIAAPQGNFKAHVLGVSLGYHFTLFANP